ncbi:DUF551 domain-containing protein [Acinetobacter calcoaceticus]|uniref:DUF551 domain-containing protein n=1 Tax=Acinetobacter calcoaceticus TaxID=471 RepID=UPI0018DEC024|nr:DUF551 domain-containing protein [Acinetobacter calcoaceticus]
MKMTEQEAFEYWADAKCYYLDKRDDGGYEKGSTALAWEIAQYFMAVGRAQAVPEWISVEDRLPDEGEEVIVHHYGHIVQATKDKSYVGGFKQRNCYGWGSIGSYISHWMPKNFKLPESFCMYYTDEHPYKETLASESGAAG